MSKTLRRASSFYENINILMFYYLILDYKLEMRGFKQHRNLYCQEFIQANEYRPS